MALTGYFVTWPSGRIKSFFLSFFLKGCTLTTTLVKFNVRVMSTVTSHQVVFHLQNLQIQNYQERGSHPNTNIPLRCSCEGDCDWIIDPGLWYVVHDLQIQISIETRDRVLGDLFQDRQHRLEKHHT